MSTATQKLIFGVLVSRKTTPQYFEQLDKNESVTFNLLSNLCKKHSLQWFGIFEMNRSCIIGIEVVSWDVETLDPVDLHEISLAHESARLRLHGEVLVDLKRLVGSTDFKLWRVGYVTE